MNLKNNDLDTLKIQYYTFHNGDFDQAEIVYSNLAPDTVGQVIRAVAIIMSANGVQPSSIIALDDGDDEYTERVQ